MNKLVIAGKQVDFINEDNHIMIDSRDVAKVFEKQHKNILRIINNRIKEDKELNDDLSWFLTDSHSGSKLSRVEDTYIKGNGAKATTYYYLMDRDVFNEVVLSFTGDKALLYRIAFIKAFNAMERKLIEDEKRFYIDEKMREHIARFLPDMSVYEDLSRSVRDAWN